MNLLSKKSTIKNLDMIFLKICVSRMENPDFPKLRLESEYVFPEWSMIDNGQGKLIPIVSGNTNEVMNATWKPYGKILRAQSILKFRVKRIE